MANKQILAGRVVSGLVGVLMAVVGLSSMLIRTPEMAAGMEMFGYPAELAPFIGAAALVSAVLYLVPKTAVLGAILLTGYFGGAVATHVRIEDPAFVVALGVGVLAWLGLWLRDARIRALLPVR